MVFNLNSIELGKTLGLSMKQSSSYKEDFIESEELASISLVPINTLLLSGSAYVYAKTLGGSSISGTIYYPFYLDHPSPTYGALDSTTVYLDGDFRVTTLSSSTIL